MHSNRDVQFRKSGITVAAVVFAMIAAFASALISLQGCNTTTAADDKAEKQQAVEGSATSKHEKNTGEAEKHVDETSGLESTGLPESREERESSRGDPSQESLSAGESSGALPDSHTNDHTDTDEPSGGYSEPITQPEKHWVVEYSQIWVEDSPAWTEKVPQCGYEERSICNVCSADITGSEASHGKQHMMAGQGSGHHNSYAQIVIGYESIDHAAEGHWETVESGGHWE